jgi:hypothetical protein
VLTDVGAIVAVGESVGIKVGVGVTVSSIDAEAQLAVINMKTRESKKLLECIYGSWK